METPSYVIELLYGPSLLLVLQTLLSRNYTKRPLSTTSSETSLAIPKLMLPCWMRNIYKSCDFVIEIPVSQPFWKSNMHEPLFLGVCLPYFRFHPYIFKNTLKLQLIHQRILGVYKDNNLDKGDILHELLSLP